MFAGVFSCGSAALENHLMIQIPGNHPVLFKKLNRQERNFIQGIYVTGRYPQVIQVGFIDRILSGLELENFQGQLPELLITAYTKDPIRLNLSHLTKVQNETAKIFPAT